MLSRLNLSLDVKQTYHQEHESDVDGLEELIEKLVTTASEHDIQRYTTCAAGELAPTPGLFSNIYHV